MGMPVLFQEILLGTAFVLETASQEVIFRPTVPTRIYRLAYVATIANTGASAILTLAIEQADGTAASPTGAAAATMTITAAQAAVNLVTFFDVQANYGDMIILPGEQLSIVTDGGGTSGRGDLWLTVAALGFNDAGGRQHAIAGAHPGSTDITAALGNVTEVTS